MTQYLNKHACNFVICKTYYNIALQQMLSTLTKIKKITSFKVLTNYNEFSTLKLSLKSFYPQKTIYIQKCLLLFCYRDYLRFSGNHNSERIFAFIFTFLYLFIPCFDIYLAVTYLTWCFTANRGIFLV
jgi:hypothetical protein